MNAMCENTLPVLLFDITKPLIYDFNDPDPQLTMFERSFAGCFMLQFSKPMDSEYGVAEIDGKNVACTVRPAQINGEESWWLGLQLCGFLHDYGQRTEVRLSGFRDADGNEMLPVKFQIETPQRVEPDPAYAVHEAIAYQAAQDGIVLLKNENGALPLSGGGTLNFFGKDLFTFRICGVGAGKVLPRYAVGLMEAARRESGWQVNEELFDFYAQGKDAIPDKQILERAQKRSDTAILLISRVAGENSDNSSARSEYYLSEEEERLLVALREHFARLVVILNVGYPISTDRCRIQILSGGRCQCCAPRCRSLRQGISCDRKRHLCPK